MREFATTQAAWRTTTGELARRPSSVPRRWTSSRRVVGWLVTAVAVAAGLLAAPGHATPVGSGTQPWLVALCTFSGSPVPGEPWTRSYYERFFGEAGAGELGMFDYWRDVSFGQLTMGGTTVTDWSVARTVAGDPVTRDEWGELERQEKVNTCINGVADDYDLTDFWGVAVVFPDAVATLAEAIDEDDTTLTMDQSDGVFSSPELFPDPPFTAAIRSDGDWEVVRVTEVDDTTMTVVRGQGGTQARSHEAGVVIGAATELFGLSRRERAVRGGTYPLAAALLPHGSSVAVAAHEIGHGFGLDHTFRLSTSDSTYWDCGDLMSVLSCTYLFRAGTLFGTYPAPPGAKPPGLVADHLEQQGWLPADRRYLLNSTRKTQATITLQALGNPTALGSPGFLSARAPAKVEIPISKAGEKTTATSDYYTVEYRDKGGWDRGFPADSVLLHLHVPVAGEDGRSVWVDQTPLVDASHQGLLYPGDQFADPDNAFYLAVHRKDPASRSATVTIASRKIYADFLGSVPSRASRGQPVRLETRLMVRGGPTAPVPGVEIVFSLGSRSCSGITDAAGSASCELLAPTRHGTYLAAARYEGEGAYHDALDYWPLKVEPPGTTLTYTGPGGAIHASRFTATAKLAPQRLAGVWPPSVESRDITFVLNRRDRCRGTTNADGIASCEITVTSPPSSWPYLLETSFAGDEDLQASSDRDEFVVGRRPTVMTYTGPTSLFDRSTATLTADLKEPTTKVWAPVRNARVTITLGEGLHEQSCSARTDNWGDAECDIRVRQPLGEAPLTARFEGDTYREPAEDTETVRIAPAFNPEPWWPADDAP